MPRKKLSRTRSSFRRAMVLFAGLVLALLLYARIPGLLSRITAILQESADASYQRGEFSEAQQDSLRKKIAGFWLYGADSAAGSRDVALSDRVEIKDNGIVWQVRDLRISLPTNDTARVREIRQAYLTPFRWVDQHAGDLLCEVWSLKRILIRDSDTCYSTERVEEAWQVRVDSSGFLWRDREYASYGDRDLSLFFPASLLDLVDEIGLRKDATYSIKGKTVTLSGDRGALRRQVAGRTGYTRCRAGTRMADVVRDAVGGALQEIPAAGAGSVALSAIVDGLYAPWCLRPLLDGRIGVGEPRISAVSISFVLRSDGIPRAVKVSSSPGTLVLWERKALETEIAKWRFPGTEAGKARRRFSGTCSLL